MMERVRRSRLPRQRPRRLQYYCERQNRTARRKEKGKVTHSSPRRTVISSGLANVISYAAAAAVTQTLTILKCVLALRLRRRLRRIRHGHLRWCHPRHRPSRPPLNQNHQRPFSTIAHTLLRHHHHHYHLPYSVFPSLF